MATTYLQKKKLIFILDNFLGGGSTKLILDLVQNLNKGNFAISIVTVYGSGPMEESFQELGIPIFFAGPKKYPISVFGKILWILTIPVILLRLIGFLIKNKQDVVITSLYSSDVIGIFASWLVRIKKRIIIYHDIQKMSVLREFIRKIFALNLAHKIIAISGTVKDFLINHWKIPENKIIVINNGIDFEVFKQGKRDLSDDLVLGFIGRFVKVKDPMCFLKSLVILKNKYNLEPKVLIAGKGELELTLKKFVKNNNLSNVLFIGWVNEVAKWLKEIDILIAPSKEEGFGLSILEGLVANKIVVGSDILPIKQLISSDDNGALFQAGNERDLAEQLKNLLSNKVLIKKYYNNVSQWVNKNKKIFDIKITALKYEEVFNLD